MMHPLISKIILRIALPLAALSMSACAHHIDIDRSELAQARAAIAEAKAAGAEECAPKLQAEAVAALYYAAHELTEHDYHPEENAELIAKAENKAKAAQQQALAGCVVEVITLEGVYFENNSSDLVAVSISTLNRGVATLKHRKNIRIEVAAHTDSRASDAYNMALSNRRAMSVKQYLVSHGISANRLTAKGYGESQPIASNATAAGQAKNRRVELRVLMQ